MAASRMRQGVAFLLYTLAFLFWLGAWIPLFIGWRGNFALWSNGYRLALLGYFLFISFLFLHGYAAQRNWWLWGDKNQLFVFIGYICVLLIAKVFAVFGFIGADRAQ